VRARPYTRRDHRRHAAAARNRHAASLSRRSRESWSRRTSRPKTPLTPAAAANAAPLLTHCRHARCSGRLLKAPRNSSAARTRVRR
jgi:hypothetical protein